MIPSTLYKKIDSLPLPEGEGEGGGTPPTTPGDNSFICSYKSLLSYFDYGLVSEIFLSLWVTIIFIMLQVVDWKCYMPSSIRLMHEYRQFIRVLVIMVPLPLSPLDVRVRDFYEAPTPTPRVHLFIYSCFYLKFSCIFSGF